MLRRVSSWAVYITGLMEAANISRTEFAARVGITTSTLQDLCSGSVQPRRTTINKLKWYIRNEYTNPDCLFAIMPDSHSRISATGAKKAN